MNIITGKIQGAQRVVIYGPEGIGKSTLASKFPNPVFIDTEGSTKRMDVARTPKPSSWTMLLEQVRYFKLNPHLYGTLVIDTADWAEQLCITGICAKYQKTGIEDFGWGKGFTYLFEDFGRLLNLLEEVVEIGINVVLTAHAKMRKFEQPDEMGAYDRWELKLSKQTAPLIKEWADIVLFANYKTYVVNVDGQGTEKGKNKVQGGSRIMYTSHHPCWDAKNRHDLPAEIPMDYSSIAHIFTAVKPVNATSTITTPDPVKESVQTSSTTAAVDTSGQQAKQEPVPQQTTVDKPTDNTSLPETIPKALLDLMRENKVDPWDIQSVVAKRGYYPADTPIEKYDSQFIDGVLIGAWAQVFKMIQELREEIPFN